MADFTENPDGLRGTLLDAALMHVPFDGWSEATFRAAATDAEVSLQDARVVCPRGALDLAVAFHKRGDAVMLAQLQGVDLGAMKVRERVTFAVRARLEAIEDKEAVRRGSALFALPMHAAEGAQLIWSTADAINWYTKRATLAGVYGSTVLYWLGDDSPDHAATWDFLDRRIEDVMRIEKVKAHVRGSQLLAPLMAGPNWLAGKIKAPGRTQRDDLPGTLRS